MTWPLAYLKGDKELLKAFVSNHITRGYHSTSKLLGLEYIKTVNDNANFSSQLFANVYHRVGSFHVFILFKYNATCFSYA